MKLKKLNMWILSGLVWVHQLTIVNIYICKYPINVSVSDFLVVTQCNTQCENFWLLWEFSDCCENFLIVFRIFRLLSELSDCCQNFLIAVRIFRKKVENQHNQKILVVRGFLCLGSVFCIFLKMNDFVSDSSYLGVLSNKPRRNF